MTINIHTLCSYYGSDVPYPPTEDLLLKNIFKVDASITFFLHSLNMPDSKYHLAQFIITIIFELSIYISNHKTHIVFQLFTYYDTASTDTYSKWIIELSKQPNVSDVSMLLSNTYGCEEHQRCHTTLCSLSMLLHEYNIIINYAVLSPVNSKDVLDGLNAIVKQ